MRSDMFRSREMTGKILASLKELDQEISVMHVCGTHQDTLVRFGLEPLLKDVGVRVRQGPGCPVCVTTGGEIEKAVQLARNGMTIASFGDMLKVSGRDMSLSELKASGADIRVVYSSADAVRLAEENPGKEVVFLGIGFETTAPTTSAVVMDEKRPENLSVLSFHRTVPPALDFLARSGEVRLDGLIEPGHVSMIIGEHPYHFLSSEMGIPQAIAGFEPLDLLMACREIAGQKAEGRAELVNLYSRVVKEKGNEKALKAMEESFETKYVKWRGFPVIPDSGLGISSRYEDADAEKRFEDELEEVKDLEIPEPPGCRCGEVLRGMIDPHECPLFGKACSPNTPVGPCMVSREGSCNILYRWGRDPV